MATYSFCESVFAASLSKWHIRKLTSVGRKPGGGIDSPSLCGHVKTGLGWDLEVGLTDFHLRENCCIECTVLYKKETKVVWLKCRICGKEGGVCGHQA